jgi:hypothetical protein
LVPKDFVGWALGFDSREFGDGCRGAREDAGFCYGGKEAERRNCEVEVESLGEGVMPSMAMIKAR